VLERMNEESGTRVKKFGKDRQIRRIRPAWKAPGRSSSLNQSAVARKPYGRIREIHPVLKSNVQDLRLAFQYQTCGNHMSLGEYRTVNYLHLENDGRPFPRYDCSFAKWS
jgi:hypothetical protein